jgi:hypothetical protein
VFRAIVAVATTAAFLVVTPPSTATERVAAPSTATERVIRPPLSDTFVIGDSTLKRVTPKLSVEEPDWYIDYQGGRTIAALPGRMDKYLETNPSPANFVMALGTNRTNKSSWTYDRLKRAIDKLPAETNVFLLLVIRAGSRQHWKDVVLQEYNGYSRQLAHDRPNTYVLNWRHLVLSDPTLKDHPVTGVCSLLEDGTHETGSPYRLKKPGPGVDTWIDMVVSKWERVNGEPLPATTS